MKSHFDPSTYVSALLFSAILCLLATYGGAALRIWLQ